MVVTINGIYKSDYYLKNIVFDNIDDENDILDAVVLYHGMVILTTTGLYTYGFNNTKRKIMLPFFNKIKRLGCTLFETFLLLDNGDLYVYKNDVFTKIIHDPITNIIMSNDIMIIIGDQNDYYKLVTTYEGNNSTYNIQKINI